jgi:hypothetical protein
MSQSFHGELASRLPAILDGPALPGESWRPHPFREFIVKVHSRCDLSCNYCYVYEMADQSWRDQPCAMSGPTADMTARRIGKHARTHSMREIGLSDAYLDLLDELDIRLFEEIMHLLLGGTGGSETVGITPAQMVVIETDGSIEHEDLLKAAYPGAAATTLHVDRDPLNPSVYCPDLFALIRYIKCRVLEDLDAGRARKVD